MIIPHAPEERCSSGIAGGIDVGHVRQQHLRHGCVTTTGCKVQWLILIDLPEIAIGDARCHSGEKTLEKQDFRMICYNRKIFHISILCNFPLIFFKSRK
jgi:hypothetical protein